MVMVMANICVMCGRYEEAIERLDYLLSIESGLTTNDFKLNEEFKPLWDLPAYQEMIRKHSTPSLP